MLNALQATHSLTLMLRMVYHQRGLFRKEPVALVITSQLQSLHLVFVVIFLQLNRVLLPFRRLQIRQLQVSLVALHHAVLHMKHVLRLIRQRPLQTVLHLEQCLAVPKYAIPF